MSNAQDTAGLPSQGLLTATDAFVCDPPAIGIDIGGTKTMGILFGPSGPLARARTATRPGLAGIGATAADVVLDLLRHSGIGADEVKALGIGIPGIVDPGAGTVAASVNLGLPVEPYALADDVRSRVDIPVHLENDVSAAAAGAARLMGLAGDVALISLGTGLAAGLVLSGRTHSGATGTAGEIGHIPYRVDGPPCGCGQRGCLELYASGSAIDRAWPTPPGHHSAPELFAAAQVDPRARAVLQEWLDALAHAVQVVAQTLDPRWIVISGGISEVGAPLLDGLTATLRARARSSAFLTELALDERCLLVPPGLDIACVGACLTARAVLDDH